MEEDKTYKQWLPASVNAMSDGAVTQPDKAGRRRKVKEGWFLLEYDDGLVAWTHLVKEDFNCARMGSWRLDLDPASDEAPEDEAEAGSEASSEADSAEENDEESEEECHEDAVEEDGDD